MKFIKDGEIQAGSEGDKIFKKLIKTRRKWRMSILKNIQAFLRLTMLWYSLKLPRFEILNPIFVVFIGNISVWISLLKYGVSNDKEEEKTEKLQKRSPSALKGVLSRSNSKESLVRSLSTVFVKGEHNEDEFENLRNISNDSI